MKENFEHDKCPQCGTPSVPFEGIPDQTLRGCPECDHEWFEDLLRSPKQKTILKTRSIKQLGKKDAEYLAFGVRWIGDNDEPSGLDPGSVSGFISTLLLADLLRVDPADVAELIVKYRNGNSLRDLQQ